jgi:hypothetical protein
MYQGSTEEAGVAIKPIAGEGMETYLRRKRSARDRDVKGEGRTMESSYEKHE